MSQSSDNSTHKKTVPSRGPANQPELPELSFKAKIFLILFPFILLLFAEAMCRIFFIEPNPMGGIIKILEQDEQLFWKQKPGLNINFQNTLVNTDNMGLRTTGHNRPETPDVTILCLGASPTFGWGVEASKSWPGQLQSLLQARFPDKSFNIVNAGSIGYTSHQGVILLNKILKKINPQIVTVSYLVNEMDKYRFFRNFPVEDKNVPALGKNRINLENLINKSSFYRFFRTFLLKIAGRPGFSKAAYQSFTRTRRVSWEDYFKNLSLMADTIKAHKAVPVFIKSHVRFPDVQTEPIIKNFDSRNLIAPEIKKILTTGPDYKQALEQTEKLINQYPWLPELRYLSGMLYKSLSKPEESEKAFKSAQKNELAECAYLSRAYETQMINAAQKNSCILIDMEKIFRSHGIDYGKKLYVNPDHDFVHPNEKGHNLIAQELEKSLIPLLQAKDSL
jgi:lysophospholipase L1-like esterase